MSIEPKIKLLITRKILGLGTQEEALQIEKWRQEDKRHEALFQNIANQDRLTNDLELYEKLDWEKAFSNVIPPVGSRSIRFQRRVMQWVAIFVFAVLTSVSIYIFTHLKADKPHVAQHMVSPGSKARLIKSDGSVLDLTSQASFRFTEAANVEVKNETGDQIIYSAPSDTTNEDKGMEAVYNTLEVPRSGEFKLILADGTKVWLNSQTILKYPVAFTGGMRDVYLTGEAYFEVAKAPKPFIVNTPEGAVQVLGTQFNVKAYLEEHAEAITLEEGKVRVSVNKGLFLDITPGYQAYIDKATRQLSTRAVNTSCYTGWREGVFRFDGETLEGVMNALARWYDFRFQFEQASTQNLHFSGTLKRYDSAEKVFDMIEQTANVKISIEDEYIVIK